MHGWRSRIGLVVPSSNTVIEPEFSSALPRGTSLHAARMSLEMANPADLERMSADMERAADLLRTADVDVVCYGCTTGSLLKGDGYEATIESRLREIAGVPAVATAASIKRAFEALDLATLAVVTPYIDELDRREEAFLKEAGYEVVQLDGLGLEANLDIGREWPADAYRRAMALDTEGADGVFISCTNYRTFEIIEPLERDLDKPVVTSNQATLWDGLRAVDVAADAAGPGSLFDR